MNSSASELSAQAVAWARVKEEDNGIRRRRALRRVDRELEKGNYKAALSLVKQLQGKLGGLRGFGAVKLVKIFILFGVQFLLFDRYKQNM